MKSMRKPCARYSQRGAALVVALIMLVMVSLLAASGFLISTSEARAAGGWSDRQRAMFLAESALREAEDVVRDGVASAENIPAAVRNKQLLLGGKGYYVRGDADVPEVNVTWDAAAKGVAATVVDSKAAQAHYMVVYEGTAPEFGTQFGSAVGSKPRFTLYARAGGIKEGTQVVLSLSQQF